MSGECSECGNAICMCDYETYIDDTAIVSSFYDADYKNWCDRNDYYATNKCSSDHKVVLKNDKDNSKWSFSWHGGKKAREYFKKHGNKDG